MKKQSLFLVLLSIFLLCLGACGQKESQSGKGMKIVTSFYPIYAMVKERSEERRVGKECLRLCRSRWSPYH